MDRALKERLIGAVVLVVIAVLVVPVFLDGPSTDAGTVSEPVILPGQNGQPRKRQTIVLEQDRDQPMPAAARQDAPSAPTGNDVDDASSSAMAQSEEDTRRASTPASGGDDAARTRTPTESSPTAAAAPVPEPQKESPPPEQPAENEPAATAGTSPGEESATGMWAVQLGSFAKRANAEGLAADLREQGYAAFLSQVETASGELNRVRVGPQKDRKSAEAVAAKLRAGGLKGQVVPHP